MAKVPKLNVRLLRRIQRHIKAEPKRYDQGKWGEHVEGDDAPACQTVGCIAGWATFLSVSPRSWLSRYLGKNQGQGLGEYGPIETRARKEIGLTFEEANDLFSPFNQDSTTGPAGVRDACKKIDALIKSRKRGA